MHEDTLLGVDKTGKTLDECANLCLSTPGCKYFQYKNEAFDVLRAYDFAATASQAAHTRNYA